MQIRIHHGAEEIGGNCIELETSGKTLLLDLGLPLTEGAKIALPDVVGLADGTNPNLLGVVLSHPHIDHYGLLGHAHASLPVWLGEGADRLLAAAAPFLRDGALPQRVQTYRSNVPFEIGPFRITPYLMDHSAFDAHGLQIDAGGKRVFYTGDFRGHGRKANGFERFLRNPPRLIDAMIMEGTTLGRSEPFPSEADLEAQIGHAVAQTSGLVLACFSAQNIDRFVTFFKAALRTNRTFIVDAYTANLIDALNTPSLPKMAEHRSIRVFLPSAQRRMIMSKERFDLVEPYRNRRIYLEELRLHPERFVMLFRSSIARDLATAKLKGGRLIWSLWIGYLDRDKFDVRQWCQEQTMAFEVIHTSGHASPDDLGRMVEALAPEYLIPIHTHHPRSYKRFGARVMAIANGEWAQL